MSCKCFDNQVIDVIGLCDTDNFNIDTTTTPNWTEISIPEVLAIPPQKPDIETIDKVFVKVKIISKRVVETPDSAGGDNAEGTQLTGRKLIIEGILKQKVVYTANVPRQTVHSAHFDIPFSAFIVIDGNTDLDAQFCVKPCVEDVFIKALNDREVFKNVTVLFTAVPLIPCP
ncbi:MAG: DUF3794 domain-containing protein [Marinisporobacter sp.]|jgi:hypothetical protein|nr:DUF3794 domain-containing protein [Marinisporobacter sp.]